ncbi:MAG TPA: DNA polymerase III subunit gamma/tau [Candidatus Saccharimonadales bacterium]
MGKALYRKYRSKTLDEVIGQQHITSILAEALKQGKIGHAFLFTGPRGTGKTSTARILAHAVNGIPYDDESLHFDIIEIDAASNRRIDDIRELREKIHIAPVSAAYKVYIIDEVHMLTGESFNALLKTLEEPPSHAIFILATTEVHKLPATIVSRTQRFHFRAVPKKEVVAHLKYIAEQEKIAIDNAALELIADHGEGSFRDSISLLDQLSSLGAKTITAPVVESILGLAAGTAIAALADAITARKLEESVVKLTELEEAGASAPVIAAQLIGYFRQHIISNPKAPEVIAALLEVAKSHNPSIKLLTVVAIASGGIPAKTVAAATQKEPVLTASVKALRAVKGQTAQKPAAEPKAPAKPEAAPAPAVPANDTTAEIIPDFNWDTVIETARTDHVSLYGVIKYASTAYEDGTLKLYFNYALHRKKVDDAKYRAMLVETITKLYGKCPVIETITGSAPPKDETAASVAAIMGGGEEVNVS